MHQTTQAIDLAALTRTLGDHVHELEDFWIERAADPANGGYRTTFDQDGVPVHEDRKYLLSHMRILWSFSALAEAEASPALLHLADTGFRYIVDHFLDTARGGWFWTLDAGGAVQDPSKLVYGQSFAIYALATYGRIRDSSEAVALATETFDALVKHAADTAWGGFNENFDGDWSISSGPGGGGDRKSLDIHMHLLEAFTELARATGDPLHFRRLGEIRELILARMLDPKLGTGGNQYSLRFAELEPIVIAKTWIAERNPTTLGAPLDRTTSYGHNLEFGWLLSRADDVLGLGPEFDVDLIRTIADQVLRHGYDGLHGGIFREGPPDGAATDLDKEFWQNAEALVGFLNAYELTDDPRYLDAFAGTWRFAVDHLIHPTLGEWRIRTSRDGAIIDGALGNYWTGAYHTTRAALEAHARLTVLSEKPVGMTAHVPE